MPITDCRSGVCHPEYLWFNGYLSPAVIGAAKNGISGIPSSYVPYLPPINNVVGAANFGNNNVPVTLKNGTVVSTAYSPGPAGANPFSQTVLLGPSNFNADISIYKVFSLSERVKLRVNVERVQRVQHSGSLEPEHDGWNGVLADIVLDAEADSVLGPHYVLAVPCLPKETQGSRPESLQFPSATTSCTPCTHALGAP